MLVGDAAYSAEVFERPSLGPSLEGQVDDEASWIASLERLRARRPGEVHYCHDPAVTPLP